MNNIIHKALSDQLIGLAYTVHNILGPGLLESAYEEGMVWELKHANIPFDRQRVHPLKYKGDIIGGYIADLVVDNKVILELKSVAALNAMMDAQLINYLKLSRIPVGYLINFQGTRVEWRRLVGRREDHSP
ncbi:MAG: GxxExxY protein [Spirochaetaceae bacterium]|nr:MAG: GxxExxY protein [Spirochaetaceae bacterium]